MDMEDEKPVPDVYDGKVVDEAGYAGLADGRPVEHRWFHARHGPHPYTLFNRYVERVIRNICEVRDRLDNLYRGTRSTPSPSSHGQWTRSGNSGEVMSP